MGSSNIQNRSNGFDSDGLMPLAVVGMSFRFPQDATDAPSFWKMLMEQRCASTEVPPERFNMDAHYHPDSSRRETSSVRKGHFLSGDIGAWDAPFFNITASEADAMDPGQRLTLETAFHALESAGIPIPTIAGTKTSVYSATFMRDYDYLHNNDPDDQPKYLGLGTSPNMLSNRVSWFFDLRGPSGSVDTACSSSLLALDLVCQSIWSGDATMGLACGSNIMLTPFTTVSLDNLGLLGKDGRCFSFDHRANGYARGEGVAVVVVKPLKDALRDGDTIRAVIRSSSSNQDGKTPTITQPSREAQERLILAAHAKAGLDLRETRYFEAHGTGTPVGDPIETRSIGAAYRRFRTPEDPLYVGSVKSNIGHLEGAAGLAGVMKTILALEAGVIPPQTNFEKLNPAIDAEFLNIKIPTEAVPWPMKGLRRASVQSFGLGGSNSHVILDDAYNFLQQRGLSGHHNTIPVPPVLKSLSIHNTPISSHDKGTVNGDAGVKVTNGIKTTNGNGIVNGATNGINGTNGNHSLNGINGIEPEKHSETKLLVWSTTDQEGIVRLKSTWRDYLAELRLCPEEKSQFIKNLAYTLSSRRTHFSHRAFAVLGVSDDLTTLVDKFSPSIRGSATPRLAYIFSGQGSQWYAMGRELFYRYPIYRKSLLDASVYLQGLDCPWDAVDELMRTENDTNVNDAEYSQPLCTIIQVALVDLLNNFGLRPTKVVGHSSGEIAAAYCAGALSKHSAWKIAYLRGLLAARLTSTSSDNSNKVKGSMMALGLPEAEAKRYLDQVADQLGSKRLVVACINSPLNVTISGEESHIDHLKKLLDAAPGGVFSRKLKVNVAYHSFQMLEVAEEYISRIGQLRPPPTSSTSTPLMASSVTGTWIAPEELLKAEYWARNMVSPVLFSDALATICSTAGKASSATTKLDRSHLRTVPITEIVEIGPHSVLQGPSREILRSIGKEGSIQYATALIRNKSATTTVQELAGRLHCLGYQLNLENVNSSQSEVETAAPLKALSTLPAYPFNHSRVYWAESRISKAFRFRKFKRHDLLGAQSFDWNPLEAKWRHTIRISDLPWVEHHKINGTVLYPASGMLVMAVEAARQMANSTRTLSGFVFHDVSFHSALVIPNDADGVEVNLHMRPRKNSTEKDAGWFDFSLYEREESSQNGWKENCNGSIQLNYADTESSTNGETDHLGVMREEIAWKQSRLDRIQKTRSSCTEDIEPDKLYDKLLSSGYNYGPSFQGITSLNYDGKHSSVATVKTYQWSNHFEGPDPGAEHVVHPTTLDTILHTMLAILTHGGTEEISTTIPTFVEHMWISANYGLSSPKADAVNVVTTGQRYGRRDARSSLTVTDSECQTVLIDVENFQTTVVASDGAQSNDVQQNFKPGYTLDWKPDLTLLSPTELQQFCDESTLDAVQSKAATEEIVTFLTASMIRVLELLQARQLEKETNSNYINWMRQQIKRLHRPALSQLDDATFEQMTCNIESHGKQGSILASIARALASSIRDSSHDVKSPELADLAQEYIDNAIQAPFFDKLCTLIDCMAHKKLSLRILELGSGNLSVTDRILTTLNTREDGNESTAMPRFASYEYTTESNESADASKSKFKGPSSRVIFKTLNIGQDPENQGFDLGSYDIVIASSEFSNLLVDLDSLKNARKLLRPGGKLISIEAMSHDESLLANFVFGLREDWWPSSENNKSSILHMNKEGYTEVLNSSKFSDLEIVLRDSHDPALQTYNIMTTTALGEHDHDVEKSNASRLVFIHNDDDAKQETIARQIQGFITDSPNNEFSDIQVTSVTSAVDLPPFGHDTMIVFLLELGAPVWYTMDEKLYNKLQKLLVSNINSKMLWVGQNGSPGGDGPEVNQPAYRLIDGLSRALNSENDGEILSLLSLQQEDCLSSKQMGHILAVIRKLHAQSDEYPDTEWVEKDGRLCVPRMVQSPSLKDKVSSRLIPQHEVQRAWKEGKRPDDRVPLKLAFGTAGLLNTLHFVEDKEYSTTLLGDGELEIEVQAVGVNYRDVLSALGRLKNAQVGCECAGIVTQVGSQVVGYQVGDRVAAISPIDCYRTYLRVDHRFTAHIPDSMPLNIAAAMIINHLTAWWTLHELAHLAPDETVLVHSAAGGTGQAAVQVAQHLGAQVLATVGTPEKKLLLKEQYGIDSDHIFSSRVAPAFARGVQRTTKSHGVDVILSALSGEGFIESWECLAPFGRFMEIGKRNIHERKSLPMARFDTGVSFHAFDIGVVCRSKPNTVRPMLESLFALYEKGVLKPAFPLQVHGVSDLEKVLRVMQRGDNMGKIVVEMRPHDTVKAVLDRKPTTVLRPDATYMVAGGLGGLGRSMTAWLVDRGARYLILLARSGPRTQEAQEFVKSLTLRGIQVATPPCDISDADALRSVLIECASTMPPICGAIQATGLLRDAIFERMSYETWQAAAAPKTLGSWNMHSLLPANLDFFIGISSVAGVAGGRGQANYAAANTYIDALMKYRVDQGLHGVALDLGIFLDIGFATQNVDLWARWEAQRPLTVTETELFALLDCCCSSENIPTQVVFGINSFVQDPSIRHQFFRKAMLRTLALEDEEESGDPTGSGKQSTQNVDFGSVFANAASLDDAAGAVNEALLRKLSTMLTLPREQLDPDTPLHTYGVDSLVAVELRNWFAKEVHAELAIFDILGGATTRTASTLAAVKSKLKKGSWEETKT
ncbi:unnamed protein product [Clonostachys rosea]|uniref:Carrier domain-containing protein n=1 Tax=Bionectria ochroleuca TaxID=29856 RepID=A0ABY6UVJ6_BIOOC|nr:unnamed protein product [Clonostachys rosea]